MSVVHYCDVCGAPIPLGTQVSIHIDYPERESGVRRMTYIELDVHCAQVKGLIR